jgi:RNA polymerase sigma-70 factor (ECF subfamily)
MVIAPPIAALKEGDEIVFREIFKDFHEKIFFYILSKSHSTYIAEEVTQITFIKLWQSRASLDESLPLLAQVFRIAKTTFIDILRKENNRRLLHDERAMYLQSHHITPGQHISGGLEEKEMLKQVTQAIGKMPPMRRKIFELSREQGMSYKEIALYLSLSVSTVKNHIVLAIRDLRRMRLILFFCATLFFF